MGGRTVYARALAALVLPAVILSSSAPIAPAKVAGEASLPPSESVLSAYALAGLEAKFPQLSREKVGFYAPIIVKAAGLIEEAPIEDGLGIPDGPKFDTQRIDYVLSGIYLLKDDESVKSVVSCHDVDNVIGKECYTDVTRAEYVSGLHFAAPGLETATMIELGYDKVDFDAAVRDAIVLDRYSESLKADAKALAGEDGVRAEIERVLSQFLDLGIAESPEGIVRPAGVLMVNAADDPVLSNYGSAYYCGYYAPDPNRPNPCDKIQGFIVIDEDNLGDMYMYHIVPHELSHAQLIGDETDAEIVATLINARMGEAGDVANKAEAAAILSRDALWTAYYIQKYHYLPIPTDSVERSQAGNLEYFINYERGFYGVEELPGWLAQNPSEKAAGMINATIDGVVSERQMALLEKAAGAINSTPEDKKGFEKAYADWSANNNRKILNLTLEYLVTPYAAFERGGPVSVYQDVPYGLREIKLDISPIVRLEAIARGTDAPAPLRR